MSYVIDVLEEGAEEAMGEATQRYVEAQRAGISLSTQQIDEHQPSLDLDAARNTKFTGVLNPDEVDTVLPMPSVPGDQETANTLARRGASDSVQDIPGCSGGHSSCSPRHGRP